MVPRPPSGPPQEHEGGPGGPLNGAGPQQSIGQGGHGVSHTLGAGGTQGASGQQPTQQILPKQHGVNALYCRQQIVLQHCEQQQ